MGCCRARTLALLTLITVHAAAQHTTSSGERLGSGSSTNASHAQLADWHPHGYIPGLKVVEPPVDIPEPITSYLACLPPHSVPTHLSTKQYVLHRLRFSAVYTYPFLFIHLCNFFPPAFYEELREAWPPMKAMIRGREATGIHNTVPDGRYKLSVFKLAEFGKLSKWKDHVKEFPAPLLKRAQKAWKEFADIILSKEFEKELLRKLKLTTTPKGSDMRLQTDVSGYSVGVHPDSVKKLLTMQFFFPSTDDSMYFYGTCVHTKEQYANRSSACNGCNTCYKKFLYQANSGYTFPVHATSFHSAPDVRQSVGKRHTALANWYKVMPEGRGVKVR